MEGETIMYVPLIGRAGGMGIIEIHGLISKSFTNLKRFERNPEVIRAMIAAKDYSFMDHTRLYRLPNTRIGGVVSEADNRDYNVSSYQVVQGKITEVVHESNGVVYFGGSRYNVQWEDGLREKVCTGLDLLKMYKNTPQSLGCTTVITEELLQLLLSQAGEIGVILEQQRILETLQRTQKSLNVPNLKDDDISDRGLHAILQTVMNIRETCLIGVDYEHEDHHSIHHATLNVLIKKNPLVKQVARQVVRTPQQVVNLFLTMKKKHNAAPKKANAAGEKVSDEHVEDPMLHLSHEEENRQIESDDAHADHHNVLFPRRGHLISENGVCYLIVEDEKKSSTSTLEWVCVELSISPLFHWRSYPCCSEFYLVILKSKNLNRESHINDLKCIEEVSKMISAALKISCEKAFRKNHRKDLMIEVEHALVEWRDLSSTALICDKIIDIASRAAPFTNIYAGVVCPGAKRLIFEACSEHSHMKGIELTPDEGISFSVVETQESIVINEGDTNKSKLIGVGSTVKVKYGKIFSLAKITRNRGHGFYDVEYAPKDKEVGVSIDRIYPLITSFRMKQFGAYKFPVFCIPLRHKSKALGVLILDTFDRVPRAPYDPQPEPGLKVFLEHLGKVLGSTIDIHKKKKALKAASKVSNNSNSTHQDLFDAFFNIIFHNLLYISSAIIVKVLPRLTSTRNVEVATDVKSSASKSTVLTSSTAVSAPIKAVTDTDLAPSRPSTAINTLIPKVAEKKPTIFDMKLNSKNVPPPKAAVKEEKRVLTAAEVDASERIQVLDSRGTLRK